MESQNQNNQPGHDDQRPKTHRDLLPRDICPAFYSKHMLADQLDDVVYDDRDEPGDGHYWCAKTCTVIGPDDDYVVPRQCRPGRGCYDGPRL